MHACNILEVYLDSADNQQYFEETQPKNEQGRSIHIPEYSQDGIRRVFIL